MIKKHRISEVDAVKSFLINTIEQVQSGCESTAKELSQLLSKDETVCCGDKFCFEMVLAIIAIESAAIDNLFQDNQKNRILSLMFETLSRSDGVGQYSCNKVKEYRLFFKDVNKGQDPLLAVSSSLLGTVIVNHNSEIKTATSSPLLVTVWSSMLCEFITYSWKRILESYDIAATDDHYQKLAEVKPVFMPRPYSRLFAKLTDAILWSIFPAIALPLCGVKQFFDNPMSWLASGFAFNFYEAFLLSFFSSTPGKALFNIKVTAIGGNNICYMVALQRSFKCWWKGLGANIPIVSALCCMISHRKLLRDGVCSWDDDLDLQVTHSEFGLIRAFFAIAVSGLIILMFLIPD